MAGDKKVKIAIETTADPAGIEQVRKRLDELQKEAAATGQSFDALATKEFGNLDTVFDEFSGELKKAQQQLDQLASKGVDVRVASSGLERIKNEIRQLKGGTVDVKDEQARKKVKALTDNLNVKLNVQDADLDEAAKKVAKLKGDAVEVKVSALDATLDETARKAEKLATPVAINVATNDATLDETVRKAEKLGTTPVAVNVVTNDATLEETVRKVEKLDQEAVDIRVNVDPTQLDQANAKLDQTKQKATAVGSTPISVNVVTNDATLDETARKIAKLQGEQVDLNIKVDQTPIDQANAKLDQTRQKAAAVNATSVTVNVATNDATLDEAVRKVAKLDQEAVDLRIGVDQTQLDQATAKLDKAKQKAEGIKTTPIEVNVKINDENLVKTEKKIAQLKGKDVDLNVRANQTEIDQVKAKFDSLKDKKAKVSVEVQDSIRKLDQIEVKLESIRSKSAKAIAIKSGDKELQAMVTKLEELERQLGRVAKGSQAFDVVSRNIAKARQEIIATAKQKGFTQLNQDAAATGKHADQLSAKLVKLRETIGKLDSKSPQFANTRSAIDRLSTSVKSLDSTAGKGTGGISALGNSLGGLAGKAGAVGVVIGTLVASLNLLKDGVAAASDTEDITVQFQVLLGSIEAAESRISELRDFAAKTPFTLKGLAEASRILETITAGALSTGEGLKLVGDLAAGTGEDFSNLALHIGRVYDGLQNGTPVGESMLRLQELGIVTAATRREIEAMQKANVDGADVWARAQQDFSRFAGSMELRSNTLSGVWSTLSDNLTLFKSTLGKPLLSPLTKLLSGLVPITDAATSALRRILENIGALERSAAPAGESVAAAFLKIKESAEKSGEATLAAARTSFVGYEKAIELLDKLGAKVDAVTQGHIDLANATTDAQIAEIEATPDTEISQSEKQIRIDELNAARRLKIKEKGDDALVRKEELTNEKISQLERSRLAEKEKREGLNAEKVNILRNLDLRTQLAKRIDESNKQLEEKADDLSHAFGNLTAKEEKNLLESFATLEAFRDKAVAELAERNREIKPDTLQKNLTLVENALSVSAAKIESEAEDRKQLEKEQRKQQEENDRQRRITNKLYELGERKEQATIRKRILTKDSTQTQANRAEALKSAQDQGKDIEKEGEATLKALGKRAEDKKAPKKLQETIAKLTESFKDGVSEDELAALDKFAGSAKTSDATAKALIATLQRVVDDAQANNARMAALEAKVQELSRGGESAPALEARQVQAQTQTITAGENFQREAFASGNTKLAENLGKAIDAVRDGATAEEARKLAEVIARASTTTTAALQAAAATAASQAGALFDIVTTLKGLQAQVEVAKTQIKGVRK
jgi:sugar phosphate isomerase/epimerase